MMNEEYLEVYSYRTILHSSFKYREVLVLYYYEEYNTSDIAKFLIVSVNTVNSSLRRGIEKLADILKED